FIESESGKEPSASANALRLLTPEAAENGRLIFVGDRRLSLAGAPCISCHTIEGLRNLGGGMLGPDLTEVYSRLGGERGLSAWLSSPASPTMKPLFGENPFSDDEITMLVSFFKSTAERRSLISAGPAGSGHDVSGQAPSLFNSTMVFLVIGLIATVAGLSSMDWIWRRRFRSVREPMVRSNLSRSET
ncbi:MAG: hypothetical protein AAB229_10095, partial [Candidatus Hydrogenedentota bacterium]